VSAGCRWWRCRTKKTLGRYRYHITRWRVFASAVVAMLVTLNGAAEATDVPRAAAAARAIMVVRNMTHPPGFLDGVRVYHDDLHSIVLTPQRPSATAHLRDIRSDRARGNFIEPTPAARNRCDKFGAGSRQGSDDHPGVAREFDRPYGVDWSPTRIQETEPKDLAPREIPYRQAIKIAPLIKPHEVIRFVKDMQLRIRDSLIEAHTVLYSLDGVLAPND
jgi:hypothetical protein